MRSGVQDLVPLLKKGATEAGADVRATEFFDAQTSERATVRMRHAQQVADDLHRQKVALLNGIDISTQQCRQFMKEDMLNFDMIFVMDNDNYEEVKRISKDHWDERKTGLLLNELYPGENRNVPDPWYGTEKDYHIVFTMLDKACDKIVAHYKNQS